MNEQTGNVKPKALLGYSIRYPQKAAVTESKFRCTAVAQKNAKCRFVDLVNIIVYNGNRQSHLKTL
jgi:hypothetical protein